LNLKTSFEVLKIGFEALEMGFKALNMGFEELEMGFEVSHNWSDPLRGFGLGLVGNVVVITLFFFFFFCICLKLMICRMVINWMLIWFTPR
jgi:hypothetical protein